MEWFDKYNLVENNIPNILDKESAVMIFNAGKFINYFKVKLFTFSKIDVDVITPYPFPLSTLPRS